MNSRSSNAFTLIELIMVITIIGILAIIAIPRFMNLRQAAQNAAAEGNFGAMRSVISIYYAKTATDNYSYLCNACPDPNGCNPLRNVTMEAPCYPSSPAELESLLTSTPTWSGDGGVCYDSVTNTLSICN